MVVIRVLGRRCAWCRRVWTHEGWRRIEPEDPARETATICPDCAETVAAANKG